MFLKRVWGRWILIVPGLFVSIKGKNHLDSAKKPCVYCANHGSYLDIVISYILMPDYFVFIGKSELMKAPLFGIFFKKGMDIAVERSSRIGSHQAFLRAGKELEKGHSVCMFPEGTISSDGSLRHFKNGAFKLAIEKQVPIVPITFVNNWKLLQNGGFFKSYGRPGIAKIIVHKPISTAGLTADDYVSLTKETRDAILEGMEKQEI